MTDTFDLDASLFMAVRRAADPGPASRICLEGVLREPRLRVRALSHEEEARLFAALREDLHAIAAFCLLTGARLGSARALRWDATDLSGARLRMPAKGGKTLDMPIAPETVALIANQPRACPTVFTWRPRRGPRRPVSPDGWRKAWAAALEAAAIPDFRFHDLRHTFATRFRRAGGDLFVLQRALAHEDLASTRRYAHVSDNDIRAGLTAMSRNSPGQR